MVCLHIIGYPVCCLLKEQSVNLGEGNHIPNLVYVAKKGDGYGLVGGDCILKEALGTYYQNAIKVLRHLSQRDDVVWKDGHPMVLGDCIILIVYREAQCSVYCKQKAAIVYAERVALANQPVVGNIVVKLIDICHYNALLKAVSSNSGGNAA